MEGKIYSIGYQNSNIETIARILERHQIDLLIDVRTHPFSKYYEDFNLPLLKKRFGKSHLWYGKSLGGKEEVKQLIRVGGLNSLMEKVREGKTICLMCMEADPGICHRKTLLARMFREMFSKKVWHLDNKTGEVVNKKPVLEDFDRGQI